MEVTAVVTVELNAGPCHILKANYWKSQKSQQSGIGCLGPTIFKNEKERSPDQVDGEQDPKDVDNHHGWFPFNIDGLA
jgi:hypothetical protein